MTSRINKKAPEQRTEIEYATTGGARVVSAAANKRKNAKRLALSALILVFAIVAFYFFSCLINTSHMKLKPDSSIVSDADYLDADISYITNSHNIFGSYSRLAYNRDGSPIKVVLNKNLNEQTKTRIRNAYEEVINPLFEVINPNYFFEVVGDTEKVPASDNVVIYFGYKPELDSDFSADGQTYYNSALRPFDNNISKYYAFADIKLWKDVSTIVILHEILHTFGFDDVYGVDNYSTLLKSGAKIAMYKPNDIRALAALYYHGGDLEGIRVWIEDYARSYYSQLGEMLVGSALYADSPFFAQPIRLALLQPPARQTHFTGISQKYGLRFEITLDGANALGGLYIMSIWDTNTNKVRNTQGAYYCGYGKLFLGVAEFELGGALMKIDLVLVQEYNGNALLCAYGSSFDIFFGEKITLSRSQVGS